MNQQPDKFFREKLEGFQKTAPSLAWERIEAGLDKKNNKGLWLKIAAALLLLAVASFVVWTNRTIPTDTTSQTATKEVEKVIVPEQKVDDTQQKAIASESSPGEKRNTAQVPAVKAMKKKKSPVIHEDPQGDIEEVTVTQTDPAPVDVDKLPVPEEIKEVEAVVTVEPVVAKNTTDTEQAVTIIYSAEEVNEKYLDKVALAKATSAQKKPSTFRKLLERAYDLKNNQDPFGDLRHKKNEILALNFKSEKRSQNK